MDACLANGHRINVERELIRLRPSRKALGWVVASIDASFPHSCPLEMEIVGSAYRADLRAPDPHGSASARGTAHFRLDPGNRFAIAVLVVADDAGLDTPAICASAAEPIFRNGLGGLSRVLRQSPCPQ